jgi:hypothetical protein
MVNMAMQIVIVLFYSLCIVDFLATTLVFAAFTYWIGMLIVVLRRPLNPTKGDLLYAALGFLVLLFVVAPFFLFIPPMLGIHI